MTPTQADRDAAAAYFDTVGDHLRAEITRRGEYDLSAAVKAFVQHRVTTEKAARLTTPAVASAEVRDEWLAVAQGVRAQEQEEHRRALEGLRDRLGRDGLSREEWNALNAALPPTETPDDAAYLTREPTERQMEAGLYASSHDSTWADVNAMWKAMFDAVSLDGGLTTRLPVAAKPDDAGRAGAEALREKIAWAIWKAYTVENRADLERYGNALPFADAVIAALDLPAQATDR